MKTGKGIDRRTLLGFGWFLAVGGGLGLVGLYHVFNKGVTKLGSLPVRLLQAFKGHRKHPARDKRLRRRNAPVWSETTLVANVKKRPPSVEKPPPSVVHWPHPELFKVRYQVKPKNALKIPASEWVEKVMTEKRIFEKGHSCAILEQLALSGIQVSADIIPEGIIPEFTALPDAIDVLRRAVNLPENRDDTVHSRRLYELLARLVCLLHDADPKKAKAQLESIGGLAKALPWAVEQDRFNSFHQKTVYRKDGRCRFRKMLQKRILAAHTLVGSVSSSGKDTA